MKSDSADNKLGVERVDLFDVKPCAFDPGRSFQAQGAAKETTTVHESRVCV